jgi:DinB superfamily
MQRNDIQDQLNQRHTAFLTMLETLSPEQFLHRPGTAWTAGQQLAHIVSSVTPVAFAFGLPKWGLRLWLGRSTRPSRDYTALVERYMGKLAAGGRATGRFVPKDVALTDKARLSKELAAAVARLVRRLDRFSEAELDTLLLPHPLLGKVTLREMLYFTLHHVDQHHAITLRNLSV